MAQVVIWLTLVLLLSAAPARATDRYISPTGSNANTCAQAEDPATPKQTLASVRACMVAGDTTYIASGTYNELFDLVGIAGSAASPFRFIGAIPSPVFLPQLSATACRSIRSSSTTNGVWIENIKFDATSVCPHVAGIEYVGNRLERAQNVTFVNVEVVGFPSNGFYLTNSTNILFDGGSIHDSTSDCVPKWRHYGFYIQSNNTNITVQGFDIYNQPGGGIQVYPGAVNGIVIRRNKIHHNSWCTSTPQGGITIFRDNTSTGLMTNIKIYDNLIYKHASPTGGRGHGIRVAGDITGVEIYNNTIYGNENNSDTGATGVGIITQTGSCPAGTCGPTGLIIKNNLVISNEGGQIDTAIGSGHVVSDNITAGVAGDYFVNAASDDYRLKQGTNTARNAGASVSTRPSPVGVTDVGAYEQGALSSAVVVGGYIEVNASVMTPSLTPASGVSGFTITCVGCTGSPVVSQAVLKAGSSTVLQLTVSGLTTSGSCTLSLGSTNLKDSGYIGPASLGLAQGLNSVSGLAVSGTCANTVGGGGAPTPTHSRFQLDEGSGTVANDDTGNGNHGTVSSGVTWVTGANGTGVTIPTDATFRHVATTYGAGVNPSTQSFAPCIKVIPDTTLAPKVYLSAGGNGTDQRAYVGIVNIGGQVQWSLGIQASGFLSTGSEFPAKNQMTLVCVVFDSATDTATLWVDGVKGALAGKSVKSYTSYTLVGNLRVGNDGTFTVNNGGFTVYMVWLWNTKPSDADLEALYVSEFPAGSAVTCYGQATHKAELISTDGTNPIAYGQPAVASYEVVDGGGIAAVIQIDCTGTAGGAVTLRFYYSTNGTDFTNEIPALLGAGGIAMWGSSTETGLNSGVATCCISGGLTANHGVTLVSSNVSPTITLSTNHSYTIRLLLRFASGLVNQSRWIVAKQDNGLALANAPTLGPMRFDLVNPRGGGMP